MERENFYLLLDLPIDPPEENAENIQRAITAWQAKWSRYRNHPTKSLEAKQYIGMIPEIRRVMLDPDLRRQEATRAAKESHRQLAQKFAEIDRHIDIRMSKGYVTDEELFKLAKLHQVSLADVRERLQQKQQRKFAEIDKALAVRMRKGYVTEGELEKIARRYAVGIADIRKRVKGTIRRTETDSAQQGARTLEKSIEKLITGNLKIVGKASLYDFLEIPPSATIAELQEKTRQKEEQLLKTTTKDALATASTILVGQCTTLFKNEENRRSYDVSRAQSYLQELNSDIDVAGLDGKIRAEYLEVLVKRAIDFGMDAEEAREYIQNYCRQKNWRIEKPAKRRSFLIAAAAVFVLLAAAGGYWGRRYVKARRLEHEYQQLTVQAAAQPDLVKRQRLFQDFISSHASGAYTQKARAQVASITSTIREQGFRKLVARAEHLEKAGQIDSALALYRKYLQAHSRRSPYAGRLTARIRKLKRMADERDFTSLQAMIDTPVYERVGRYLDYLKQNPASSHRQTVLGMIQAAREEYYLHLIRDCKRLDRSEQWESAKSLIQDFLKVYPDDSRRVDLTEMLSTFDTKIRDNRMFEALKKRAEQLLPDFKAARQVYSDYLLSYPDSTARAKAQAMLHALDLRREAARLEALRREMQNRLTVAKRRFAVVQKGVVQDKSTGLMWCLLDSQQVLQKASGCMNYAAARRYIKSLKTGGFSDWRLPTAAELTALYKKRPFFPSGDPPSWYWSADSYARYADGWSKIVDVVSSRNVQKGAAREIDSRDCAVVRAVRP